MLIVYRLNEALDSYEKGDIISADTLNKLIQEGWYEISVTLIVVQ